MAGIAGKTSELKYAKGENRRSSGRGDGSNAWPKITRRAYTKSVRQANREECRTARLGCPSVDLAHDYGDPLP